ncbi:hypothetical protein GCM10022239_05880 [Leifsonia bigeumensis]|uniref:Dihydrodipicolinate synthase family protein n=1 Tax=Leifsonella bigeumensis TaxID=433643 RepID=A0ABP7F5X3_9MICO
MYPVVREAAHALRGRVIAAVATPMTMEREIDSAVNREYFRGVLDSGVDGLAVALHTGRGPMLGLPERVGLVRDACALTSTVVTGVSAAAGIGSATEWSSQAALAGATSLVVLADRTRSPAWTLELYDSLWEASGLPLIVFDLYTAPYPLDDLRRLLDHPAVAGLKPARLYDAIACQNGIAAALERGRCVLSGEDRMLGPSLMWGAQGALVGIAAASAAVTTAVVSAHRSEDAESFLRASAIVDELAAVTFREPWDGYVQRMLWIAASEGLVPSRFAVDLFRPPDLLDSERVEVVEVAARAREAVRELDRVPEKDSSGP